MPPEPAPVGVAASTDTAVFAGGCFWGVEAVFEHVKGVISATSGYAGGSVPSPSYEQVSSGETGHAESVRVVYDPGAGQLRPAAHGVLHRGPRPDPVEPPGAGPGDAVSLDRVLLPHRGGPAPGAEAYIAQT